MRASSGGPLVSIKQMEQSIAKQIGPQYNNDVQSLTCQHVPPNGGRSDEQQPRCKEVAERYSCDFALRYACCGKNK